MRGNIRDIVSYLRLIKINNEWKITEEGDSKPKTTSNTTETKKESYDSKEEVVSSSVSIPKDAVKGDFNGDGNEEYAWLEAPEISDGEWANVMVNALAI